MFLADQSPTSRRRGCQQIIFNRRYLAINDNVKIPKALVKRINRVTAQVGVTSGALVKTALANQLDYEEWFVKAVDEGIADLDAGRTFSTRKVLAAIGKRRNERAERKRKQAA